MTTTMTLNQKATTPAKVLPSTMSVCTPFLVVGVKAGYTTPRLCIKVPKDTGGFYTYLMLDLHNRWTWSSEDHIDATFVVVDESPAVNVEVTTTASAATTASI
jgi:hypothetical protein